MTLDVAKYAREVLPAAEWPIDHEQVVAVGAVSGIGGADVGRSRDFGVGEAALPRQGEHQRIGCAALRFGQHHRAYGAMDRSRSGRRGPEKSARCW